MGCKELAAQSRTSSDEKTTGYSGKQFDEASRLQRDKKGKE